MNALDTHDTPRFRTSARPGTVPVAFGLAVTLPGIPVVWAGDEFGLTGVDGEASRTPIPWGSEGSAEVAPVLATYRSLVALRRAHPVLATGGIRWLAVGDDAVAFVRESADETLLVFAARAAATLSFGAAALSWCGCRGAGVRGRPARGIRWSRDAVGGRAGVRGVAPRGVAAPAW